MKWSLKKLPKQPYATIHVTYRSGRKENIPVTRDKLEPTKASLNALSTVDFFEVK